MGIFNTQLKEEGREKVTKRSRKDRTGGREEWKIKLKKQMKKEKEGKRKRRGEKVREWKGDKKKNH